MRLIKISLVALAGFGMAALTGLALGKAAHTTVIVEKNVKDTMRGNKLENVVATPKGLALYHLSGESKTNAKCTKAKMCFPIWKPYTVASATTKLTKPAGVKGKLSLWHRNGFFQVVLGGHPLYMFLGPPADKKGVANGDLSMDGFGGTWHLIPDPSGGSGMTTSTMTTMTTSTMPCPYPPHCP